MSLGLLGNLALLALGVVANSRERGIYEQRMVDLSLTCRSCNNLAPPISGTKNRYRCKCGRQFFGPKHYL